MKKLLTAVLILLTTQACNREDLCITYPEDTKEICGKTHSHLVGKKWHLDSVLCNGVNVTQKVFDTLNVDKYYFTIGNTFIKDGNGREIATAGIVLGDTGHWAHYIQLTSGNDVLDKIFINGEDSLTAYGYSFLYVFGLKHGIERAGQIYKFDGQNLKLGTSTLKDSLVTSFFSAR